MSGRPVELRIAGQTYRVVSSAGEEELHRLAAAVTAKIVELTPPGRAPSAQSVLLAALALAHDLEEERGRRAALEARTRGVLERVLGQIDDIDGALADAEP